MNPRAAARSVTFAVFVVLQPLLVRPAGAQGTEPPDVSAVDAIFQAFDNTRSPGCAVGVWRALTEAW